ncbi:MAG: hypothetical protein KOO60_10995 [Gemmatimonadales bacterium]|nr:hypothetical protein [Gemmatimonadales bacterium]
MNQVQVESFDFTDANNWTPAGHGAISGDVLTLTDPVIDLLWNVHNWDPVPALNGDNDCIMADGAVYLAEDGGANYDFGDYCFVFWLKLNGVNASHFYVYNHRSHEVGNAKIGLDLYRPAAANLRLYTRRTNNFVQDVRYLFSVTSYGDPLWADGAFRKVVVSYRGNRLRVFIDGIVVNETCGLDLDETSGGSVALEGVSTTPKWVVGGGAPSSTDNPYISEPRTGEAVLSAAGRWTLPADFVSFDKLRWAYDDVNDADEEQKAQVTISVRIYDTPTTTWGSWTALDVDGDMGGVSANALDVLDIKVELDNEADINEPFTSYPAVKDLSVVYNATGHSFMRQRREPILRRRG